MILWLVVCHSFPLHHDLRELSRRHTVSCNFRFFPGAQLLLLLLLLLLFLLVPFCSSQSWNTWPHRSKLNQSTNKESLNQSINQSTNQSINQSINRSIHPSLVFGESRGFDGFCANFIHLVLLRRWGFIHMYRKVVGRDCQTASCSSDSRFA